MHIIQKKLIFSKVFPMWITMFLILFIKSNLVILSLYSMDKKTLIFNESATIMPTLFLVSFSLIFSQKAQLIYLVSLDLFISLLFIADIVYARAFGHLISVYMIFTTKYVTEDLNTSIVSLLKWTDFLMLIDFPYIYIRFIKLKQKNYTKKRMGLFCVTIMSTMSLIFLQFMVLQNNNLLINYEIYPIIMSPIGNHIFDLYRFVYESTYILKENDMNSIINWLSENSRYQLPDDKYKYLEGLLKGKNLIVIHFESLENIVVGQSYYGQEITPNINRLLDNSIYFDNIHEQVRDGNSSDAELMFNSSIYPLTSGSAFMRFGENTYTTLPKLLGEEGYTSIAIHGDNKEFWNRYCALPALGFNKFIDETQFNDKTMIGMGISDESLFSQSISEIKKLKEPYNILIITLTSHMPFTIDKKYQYLNLPNNDETSAYLQSVHYTDKAFGEFYNRLKEEGFLQNSVLMIYGDHEGIHKYYQTTLPDNKHKLPFIINIPGMNGFRIDKIGGQVDLMPTVAYLLGIDKEKYASRVMGRNLLGSASGTAILPTGQILGQTDDSEHLAKAQSIADMIIRGNYFSKEKIYMASENDNQPPSH